MMIHTRANFVNLFQKHGRVNDILMFYKRHPRWIFWDGLVVSPGNSRHLPNTCSDRSSINMSLSWDVILFISYRHHCFMFIEINTTWMHTNDVCVSVLPRVKCRQVITLAKSQMRKSASCHSEIWLSVDIIITFQLRNRWEVIRWEIVHFVSLRKWLSSAMSHRMENKTNPYLIDVIHNIWICQNYRKSCK